MMKKILLFLLSVVPAFASAQHLEKGYHGFVDIGYSKCISQLDPSAIEITTSHGYQFNPYIYLGGGVGFDFTGSCSWGEVDRHAFEKRESKVDIPVFFNFRSNFTKTKFSPYFDAKVGAYLNNDCYPYATLAFGCRCSIGNNMGISLSAGYKYRKATVEHLEMTSGNKYNNYQYSFYYRDKTGYSLDGFFVKAGFDF